MLNDYFSKCFNRSQPSLQTTDCLNYPLDDDCPDEILCTESEITELLMTLDIVKANDPDGISAWMSRETAVHISPSLTKFLIYPSSLDHFLHFGKSQTLFQSQKPMTTVIHLTTGPYLYYLSWANYIGEACSPHYFQACVHKPTVWQCTVGIPKSLTAHVHDSYYFLLNISYPCSPHCVMKATHVSPAISTHQPFLFLICA